MNSIYRNRRTANGLKRGVRVELDSPKRKPTPKKEFDLVKFLTACANDKEAYSDKERAGFRKAVEEIEALKKTNSELSGRIDELLWENTGARNNHG
jgi:uncharacterized protein YifE (UPF0438 family)